MSQHIHTQTHVQTQYKLYHRHTHRRTDTNTHTDTDTHTHRHRHTHRQTQTQTHTDTHTQTHTHTDTHTHRHRHTDTETQKFEMFAAAVEIRSGRVTVIAWSSIHYFWVFVCCVYSVNCDSYIPKKIHLISFRSVYRRLDNGVSLVSFLYQTSRCNSDKHLHSAVRGMDLK